MAIHYSDSIRILNLSTRSYNALVKAGIFTIDDLINTSKNNLYKINKLGSKSINEINDIIDELNNFKKDIYYNRKKEIHRSIKTFIGNDGSEYLDVKIEKLGLSKRAYNCLHSAHIKYYSQLITKTQKDLISLPNFGKKSLKEIEEIKNDFKIQLFTDDKKKIDSEIEDVRIKFYLSITSMINIKYKDFLEIFDETYKIYKHTYLSSENQNIFNDKKFQKILYVNKSIKKSMYKLLLTLLDKKHYGVNIDFLLNNIPECLRSYDEVNKILNNLVEENKISLCFDDKYKKVYAKFLVGTKKYLSEKEYEVLFQRVHGQTLEFIGNKINVTRERIRQIEERALKKINDAGLIFSEDQYLDIFLRYDISKEDFKIAFSDDLAHNYLVLRYGTNKKKGTFKKPLEDILDDKTIPMLYKKLCKKAIYKNHIKIGKEYIMCTRSSIVLFVLKTKCLNTVSFEEFSQFYFKVLDDIDKRNLSHLSIMNRAYQNEFSKSNIVLWTLGKKIRYYNIASYDFDEFFNTLNLTQYNNVEFSTLKFFELYPELMKMYDIRNEYELHNLMKKICVPEKAPNIVFKRMPTIEFGKASRENQVLELLKLLAPITNFDFAKEYEKEYGISSRTVLANYMTNFDQYFHNGIYRIDYPQLPTPIAQKLKLDLTDEFYTLQELHTIFKNEFPQLDKSLLNPFSIKEIGFKIYSNYVFSDKYKSISDYINAILTKEDVVNLNCFSDKLRNLVSLSSQLYKLKSEYTIIEFSPNKYINLRKLTEIGISKNQLEEYCDDVCKFIGTGKYFTFDSLKNDGFYHTLDDLGFENWFYTSLLIENKNKISYQRIGGNKVMVCGSYDIRFEDFLEFIVFQQEGLSIGIIDLQNLLQQYYNIKTNLWKLMTIIRSSTMHYDPIFEKVYADYDVYFEEV